MHEQEIKQIFQRVSGVPQAPPYLETRVLASLRSSKGDNKLRFWKQLAFGGSFAGVALGVVLSLWVMQGPIGFVLPAGQPFVVRMDVQPLGAKDIVLARVVLPEGLEFYAEGVPGLERQKTLDLAWGLDQSSLAFVVKGKEPGVRTVQVEFFDGEGRRVASRKLRLRVQAG